jgi:seryl-tRNA synthetase
MDVVSMAAQGQGVDWFSIISLILNLVLGGGFLVTIMTIRSIKNKASAEAKGADAIAEGSELDNVQKAIAIWRESAEASEIRYKSLLENYSQIANKVGELETTVRQLTATNKLILKILNSINHDNLEQKKQEAKDIAG